MKTQKITTEINLAIDSLKIGKLVAIPTETVYGLAGNAYNEKALKQIFILKKRPLYNPLILHISSYEKLQEITKIQYMIDEFAKRREIIIELLNNIPGIKLNKPSGAFYIFPDISSYFGKVLKGKKIENATDFALYLLEKAHVATVTGEAFGNGNCIRISYAASEENIRLAIERISTVLK